AHRTHRDDLGAAGALQGVDVGAEVELGGRHAMAAAVARQEDEAGALELAQEELVGGLAERRVHLDPARAAEPVDVIESAATDDADDRRRARCRHLLPLVFASIIATRATPSILRGLLPTLSPRGPQVGRESSRACVSRRGRK